MIFRDIINHNNKMGEFHSRFLTKIRANGLKFKFFKLRVVWKRRCANVNVFLVRRTFNIQNILIFLEFYQQYTPIILMPPNFVKEVPQYLHN